LTTIASPGPSLPLWAILERLDPDTLISYKDLGPVEKKCRVHLNRLIDRGEFPAPVQVSRNRKAWRAGDIVAYRKSLPVVEPAEPKKHTPEARARMRAAWERRRAAARPDKPHSASRVVPSGGSPYPPEPQRRELTAPRPKATVKPPVRPPD